MDNKLSKSAGDVKQVSRKGRLLLAAILAVAVAVGALALFQPTAPQAGSPASVSDATVPQDSQSREMFQQHKDLAQGSGVAEAHEVAAPADREMFEQHKYLAQQNGVVAANEVATPADREMFEQHRLLAQH